MPQIFPCPHCRTTLYAYAAGEAFVRCPACAHVVPAPKAQGQPPGLFSLQPFSISRFFVDTALNSETLAANG